MTVCEDLETVDGQIIRVELRTEGREDHIADLQRRGQELIDKPTCFWTAKDHADFESIAMQLKFWMEAQHANR